MNDNQEHANGTAPPAASPDEVRLDLERQRLERWAEEQAELLNAERAAAAAEAQARQQALNQQAQTLMERLQELYARERDLEARASSPAGASATEPTNAAVVAECENLRRRVQEDEEVIRQLQHERDHALADLDQLRHDHEHLQRLHAEQEVAVEQMRQLQKPDDWSLGGVVRALGPNPAEDVEALRRQCSALEESLRQLQSERDDARAELQRRLAAPADVAASDGPRRAHDDPTDDLPPDADIGALRRKLTQDQRKLVRDLRDLHQRESTIEQKAEATRRELAEQKARLDRLTTDLDARKRDLDEGTREVDDLNRKVVLQEAEVRLEQAELREMQLIAEQEVSHERAQLTQERLRIARLREMLKMEQTAFHAAVERYGQMMDERGAES